MIFIKTALKCLLTAHQGVRKQKKVGNRWFKSHILVEILQIKNKLPLCYKHVTKIFNIYIYIYIFNVLKVIGNSTQKILFPLV